MSLSKEKLTSTKKDLSADSKTLSADYKDLTACAKDLSYRCFGENVRGIYVVRLQSESYIESYLEINGIKNIDLETTIAKLCIGTGVILITAITLPALPLLAGVSAFSTTTPLYQVCVIAVKITKEAVAATAFDTALSSIKEYYNTGNINKAMYKAVEAAGDGFMWSAIFTSAIETVKEIKLVHLSVKEKEAIKQKLKSKLTKKIQDKAKLEEIASNKTDNFIKILNKTPKEKQDLLYDFFASYPDDALAEYNKFQDDILDLFEKLSDSDFDDAIKTLSKLQKNEQTTIINILKKVNAEKCTQIINLLQNHPDFTSVICGRRSEYIIWLLEKVGTRREISLLNIIKSEGDEILDIFKTIPSRDIRRTVDFLNTFDYTTFKKIAKNGRLPDEITIQLINDAKYNSLLKDSISEKLKNPNTGEIIKYVKHEERYLNPYTQELKPNIIYRTGEGSYYYQTDEFGRITKTKTTKLRLQEDIRKTETYERGPHNTNTFDKKENDDAGHLFASRFGGSGELDNLISQNYKINRGTWKKMEKRWTNALKEGKEVQVEMEIVYDEATRRPKEFNVTEIIDGKVKKFPSIKNY